MNLSATIVDFTSDERFRSSRTCEGGIHMTFDRPVHATEAADGTTAPAVHGGIAQMFTSPIFALG